MMVQVSGGVIIGRQKGWRLPRTLVNRHKHWSKDDVKQ